MLEYHHCVSLDKSTTGLTDRHERCSSIFAIRFTIDNPAHIFVFTAHVFLPLV
jgi:hypothetical protein